MSNPVSEWATVLFFAALLAWAYYYDTRRKK